MACDYLSCDPGGNGPAVAEVWPRSGAPLALLSRLRRAERLLEDDPDKAALVLDGVIWSVVNHAFARVGQPPPSSREDAFEALSVVAAPVCWRLRLALRSPHAQARLAHAWALLDAVFARRGVSIVSR
jgi:hypothetical protein